MSRLRTLVILASIMSAGCSQLDSSLPLEPTLTPTAKITADLPTIDRGDEVSLTLESTNASDGLLLPTGATLLNGTVTDSPDFTTTYLFIVDGPDGSAHDAVTVEVIQPPDPPEGDKGDKSDKSHRSSR